MQKKTTAQRLRALRAAMEPMPGQDKVADAIGVSTNALGKWERGESEPRSSDIAALASFYRVSADFLVGLSEFEHGLAPDMVLIDLDEEANPTGKPLGVKIPRRLQIIDMDEFRARERKLRKGRG